VIFNPANMNILLHTIVPARRLLTIQQV